MARMTDWQRDIFEAKRSEHWSLRGPNQVIKVVTKDKIPNPADLGYVTLGKYLLQKTPQQIQISLGLKNGELKDGAKIYRFNRLPQISECEYDLTAQYPGGLAYVPAHSNPDYLPGDRVIHQWRIKKGVHIPLDLHNVLDLKPGQQFPYSWLQS